MSIDNRSEDRHLSEFHIWLWNTKPETRRLCYHVKNEGSKNPMLDLAKGVVSGAPDYVIDIPCNQINGLRLEFKLAGKTQSDNQKEVERKLIKMGFHYQVIFSCEEAIEVTEKYLAQSPQYQQLLLDWKQSRP
jgi:hypothetical protein